MPKVSGSNFTSGFLNLNPRIQLKDLDNNTITYPTVLRTGDPDFSIPENSFFDDTNSIIYSDSVNILYPTGFQPTGKSLNYISSSISEPNLGSDIVIQGNVNKNISENFIQNTLNQQNFQNLNKIGPFSEHIRSVPNDNDFYSIGTNDTMLPGFSNRLGSKTIIKIPINVTQESSIFWSTGTLPNALGTDGGVNSGISYFNFETGIWEPVGVDQNTTTGSLVDYMNSDLDIRKESYLMNGSFNNFRNNIFPNFFQNSIFNSFIKYLFHYSSGKLNNRYGFPSAEKFEPKNQNTIKLSNFINQPFVVEKIKFVWSGSLDLPNFNQNIGQFFSIPHRANFGILNVFKNNNIGNFRIFRPKSNFINLEMPELNYNSKKQIDVICNFTIQSYQDPFGSFQGFKGFSSSNFYFKRGTLSDLPGGGITGSFELTGSANIQGNLNDFPQPWVAPNLDNPEIPDLDIPTWYGGRSGLGLESNSSNRSLSKLFISDLSSAAFSTLQGVSINELEQVANLFEKTTLDNFTSPYILFPEDEICFFCANQPKFTHTQSVFIEEEPFNFFIRDREFEAANQFRWTFAPGEHYVLLYGSLVKDNIEFHENYNQPLQTNNVHESLKFNNSTLDQFQIESLNIYSGSYIDDIVQGNFSNINERGVVGSTANGTQGVTGSLLRGVKLIDEKEIFSDSLGHPNLAPFFRQFYGYINRNLYKNNLVFRHDTFGQFRDMLEQRLDSKFSNNLSEFEIFRVNKQTIQSPIFIKFFDINQGKIIDTPVSSSNKSKFATSSLPYFDGISTN